MSIFKRLRATFNYQINEVVNQIENQDAVVAAILKESRESLAQARVRLGRVAADAEQSAARLTELEGKQVQWVARAKQAQRSGDEAKAMACLKEKRACAAEYNLVQQRHTEHCSARIRIESDVRTAEEKLQALLQKQHLLRTRESAAATLASIQKLESEHGDDLATTFERWEMKISGNELLTGQHKHSSISAFEQSYISSEEEAELRDELASLAEDDCLEKNNLRADEEEGK